MRGAARPIRITRRKTARSHVSLQMAKKSDARDAKIVTAAALADLIGVSPRTVADLTKRGVMVKAGAHGYVLRKSVRGYVDYLRKSLAGRGGETGIATATAERARLAKEQADNLALRNAAMRGTLLDAAAAEREWSDILRMVRAGCLAVPSRAAQRLPHLSAHDLTEIDAEIRVVLTELGNDIPGSQTD